MEKLGLCYGRIFTSKQLPQNFKEYAKRKESMKYIKNSYYCNRCEQKVSLDNRLPSGKLYCRECIIFGRNDSDDYLYYFERKPFDKKSVLNWQGKLTSYQEMVSNQLIGNYQQNKISLVHAVTGAGKTEMIYPLITQVLESGGWVCLACPRVDVCIELAKRITRDFSCSVSLLHANSTNYHRSPIVIATTHQLLKFYEAFDLIIVDEIDAFPFVNNEMLNKALKKALHPSGKLVYLTATSTKELNQEVKKGNCHRITLARRFHNNPLIVPQFKIIYSFSEKLNVGKLPRKFINLVNKQRKTNYPLLLFFPIIENGKAFEEQMRKYFPNERIAFVSSQSENRLELIEKFRNGEISILISTTILERGVTFPGVDVFVLASHHKLFNTSSLIQIAGRVGRSLERPNGQLLFIHEGISLAMIKAKKEIKEMNKIAYG